MKELFKDRTYILAHLILATSYFLIFTILMMTFDGTKRDIAMIILGYAISQSSAVVQYYFGSSTGSKSKQETIDKMNDTSKIVLTDADSKPTQP